LEDINCVAIKNIKPNLNCTVVYPSLVLVEQGFISAVEAGTEIGFKITNIQNPAQSVSSEIISSQFELQTFTWDKYLIDQAYNLDFSIGCIYPCLSCD
jgi:hypothetical protein